MGQVRVGRQPVTNAQARQASRRWWDSDADAYHAEHGEFLGEVDLRWCPEGLREEEVRVLGDGRGALVLDEGYGGVQVRRRGDVRCDRVLMLGGGCAAGARCRTSQGAFAVGLDLSAGMLRHAAAGNRRSGVAAPLVQADALALPFRDRSFDL